MRIGKNPAKEAIGLEVKYYHRIIVPVYIPNFDGYFKDAKQILTLCLNSILNTIHEKACVTVVNNGCCEPIRQLLDEYFSEGKIDQLVHFNENKGKVDAIYSVAKGCYEPLITITDSDILFLPGWIAAVEQTITVFPEIGLISPCPVPALWNYTNSSTLLSGLLGFNGRFEKIISDDDLLKFPKSVNKDDYYQGKEALLQKQLCLTRKDRKILIGCGHFAATLRREVFKFAPDMPSLIKITGKSEFTYIDEPVDRAGLLRVGTSKILAHHMGNHLESWMTEELKSIIATSKPSPVERVPDIKRTAAIIFPYKIRRLLNVILAARFPRSIILKLYGVSQSLHFKS
jgi:hypothetical protein